MPPKGSQCAHSHAAARTATDEAVNAASSSASVSAVSAGSTHSAAVASSSPACKLYRNLLECVFAFGSFADLCALMRVSRDWGAAVLTMAPIAGVAVIYGWHSYPKPANLVGPVCASRLRRHVAELQYDTRAASGPRSPGSGPQCHLDPAELRQVAAALPWMRVVHLYGSTNQATDDENFQSLCSVLPRFTAVRRLALWASHRGSPEQVGLANNRVIAACSRLSSLQTLDLRIPGDSTELSFAPFVALTNLRVFQFHVYLTPVNADDFTAGLAACREMRRVELTGLPLTSRHLEALLPSWPLLESLELSRFERLEGLRGFAACSSSVLRRLSLLDLFLCPPTELEHLLGLSRLSKLTIRNLQSPATADLASSFIRSPRFPWLLFADFYSGDGSDAYAINGKPTGAAVARG